MSDGIPAGFARIEGANEVFVGNGEVIVLGDPPHHEREEDETHNCDAMGCRWSHVLYRSRTTT